MTRNEYTPDGYEQETIDERIAALMHAWAIDDDDEPEWYVQDMKRQAYELAVEFPSEIATDLFVQMTRDRA